MQIGEMVFFGVVTGSWSAGSGWGREGVLPTCWNRGQAS